MLRSSEILLHDYYTPHEEFRQILRFHVREPLLDYGVAGGVGNHRHFIDVFFLGMPFLRIGAFVVYHGVLGLGVPEMFENLATSLLQLHVESEGSLDRDDCTYILMKGDALTSLKKLNRHLLELPALSNFNQKPHNHLLSPPIVNMLIRAGSFDLRLTKKVHIKL